MNFLKRLFLIVISLTAILIIVSFFLPQKQQVKRSVAISAPAEKIYPYLANPKLFAEWSPWSRIDPNMKLQYIGPESGKGAGMTWQSDQPSIGNGSWTIVEEEINKSLNVDMDFGKQGTATSFFKLQANAGNTQVIWGFETDAGMNPVMRWMGLLMDRMVGTEYEKGLLALKDIVEK